MFRSVAVAIVATCLAVPALAQNPTARKFGERPAILQASISPDGTKIAMITPIADSAGSTLVVLPVDGSSEPVPILRSSGKPDKLSYCLWSTSERLVCSIYFLESDGTDLVGYTRMVALDADGSKLQQLTAKARASQIGASYNGGGVIDWLPEEADSVVLMTRSVSEEYSTGNLGGRSQGGLAVEKVDTVSLKRSLVEQPKGNAFDYVTDGRGNVRVMGVQATTGTGYASDKLTYFYRTADSRAWKPLTVASSDSQRVRGFTPVAVDSEKNVVYGFDDNKGHTALFSIALDGSMNRQLVFGRDDVDVDEVVQVGRARRVVGVSYATDKRQTEFFDPELAKLGASLVRALPGHPMVSFVDESTGEKKLLLFSGSDTDPGRYYVFDRETKQLAEVLPLRPQLAGVTMAAQKPITYPARDGTPIPAYLTLPPGSDGKGLPVIVMPHGGPSARDEWGFDWLPQYFAARGFAVIQPNYRGSAGFGEAWFQNNGFQSWKTAMSDINDAGRWALSQGIAAPDKLAIFGWSYGGYAALQTSVADPDLFKAIVAVAPVTDLETYREEWRNFGIYKLVDSFVGRGAHVQEGSPAQNAAKIKAPVLLFHGDRDRNVGVGESRLMASRLKSAGKQVDYVEFDGLDHQLDDSAARAQMLDKSDAFIRTALGLPARP